MFDKYYDFFEEKPHIPGEVSIDEFIYEATRTDIQFLNKDEELSFLSQSRMTLRNELFTCYYYLKQKGLLEEYHQYRNGE